MAGRFRIVCLVVLLAAVGVAVVYSQAQQAVVPPPPPSVRSGLVPPPPPVESPKGMPPVKVPVPDAPPLAEPITTPPAQRAIPRAEIDPKTPEADLLPPAAKGSKLPPVYLGDDLKQVPELTLESPPAKPLTNDEWTKRIAHSLDKAEHLNGRKRDGFVLALMRERADLAGLPFQIGDDGRRSGRGKAFKELVEKIRAAGTNQQRFLAALPQVPVIPADKEIDDASGVEESVPALVASLSQVGTESAQFRFDVVNALSFITRNEATQQLARMALFDPDRYVRELALKALSVRRESHYTGVLVQALRYPWPSIAERAAEAIVKLERRDLLPELIAVLDESDPRLPQTEKVDDKPLTFTRELVRVNHNKCCLLCHAPADTEKPRPEVLVAEMPVPSDALPPPAAYNQSGRGLLVRIDVTYLHQDFSLMLPIKDAAPWPDKQRFDFLVRKRPLTDIEADELRARLETKDTGKLSPYHRAAVRALRDLTGHDLEAKAEAWRKLLKLPVGDR